MTKLRKQRRKKTFKHNVNRKRLRNKIFSTGKAECKEIENAWEKKRSVRSNLKDMGLSYDPNETIKVTLPINHDMPTVPNAATKSTGWNEEEIMDQPVPCKHFVAEALEKDAKAPREKLFRMPKGQVEWITYLLDKYGHDYKAMAKDKKNHYQETWKQIRAKIKRFMMIPDQYSKYLESKGLLDQTGDDENNQDEYNLADSDSD